MQLWRCRHHPAKLLPLRFLHKVATQTPKCSSARLLVAAGWKVARKMPALLYKYMTPTCHSNQFRFSPKYPLIENYAFIINILYLYPLKKQKTVERLSKFHIKSSYFNILLSSFFRSFSIISCVRCSVSMVPSGATACCGLMEGETSVGTYDGRNKNCWLLLGEETESWLKMRLDSA